MTYQRFTIENKSDLYWRCPQHTGVLLLRNQSLLIVAKCADHHLASRTAENGEVDGKFNLMNGFADYRGEKNWYIFCFPRIKELNKEGA